MFLEPRGSAARTWRLRWRRVRCALGLHGWMFGPFDSEGRWVDEDHVPRPNPLDEFVPYTCAFGWPWCRATKRVPR